MVALNLVEGDDEPEGGVVASLAMRETPDIEIVSWKDQAVCHGLHEVFDLDNEKKSTKDGRKRRRQENRAKARVARSLCMDCPVFEQCWSDAWDSDAVGVIRAAAVLNSDIRAVREKRLTHAMNQYRSKHVEHRNERSNLREDNRAAPKRNTRRAKSSAKLQSV